MESLRNIQEYHREEDYTVIHLLVVDVACVLFWTQSVCMVPNQNTRNIYHKQMNNGVFSALFFQPKVGVLLGITRILFGAQTDFRASCSICSRMD